MGWIRRHLSYANVMATIAVFLALGGSGYAALNGKDKKKVRAIADQEIAAKAGGLSVANAASASHAESADTAANSANSANSANADTLDNLDSRDIGIGFLSGRVDNLALTGSTGSAPTGISAAAGTTTLADQDMTLSPNRTIVMRNFRVTLTQPMGCPSVCGSGEVGIARLDAFAPGSGAVTTSVSCNITALTTTCTGSGPSGIVPAGSSLRMTFSRSGDAQYDAGTDGLFSWQATAN
jgi:hypothetical protein